MDPFQNFSRKLFSLSACCLSLSFFPQAVFAGEAATSPHEALLLKRIVEYWKDEDYTLAKKQIHDFLAQYEQSAFKDHLMSMLGDLYFNEANYQEAITHYSRISSQDFKEKSYIKHLKALFELGEFSAVEHMAAARAEASLEGATSDIVHTTLLYADALYRQGKTADALPYFEALSKTEYHDFCLLPLAEGYRATQDFPKAVATYRTLLDNRADKKDEILFQIASLESEYDKRAAAKTFLEVASMDGEKRGVAAFNYLTLSYDQKAYAPLLETSEKLISIIPEEKLALARYYIGGAHFALKNYAKAIPVLEAYVQTENEASPRLKTALLNLMLCARETDDSALSERVLQALATHFSSDPAYLQSFLVKAQMQKEEGALALSSDELKKLLEISEEFDGREKIFYDVALLLLEDEKWDSGREILQFFIEQYPQSEKRAGAYRHLLNTSIEAMKTEPDSKAHKELFVSDLQKIFAQEGIFSEEEDQEYRLSFAKTLYELGRPLEALKEAEEFLSRYSGDPRASDAHLMAALCAKEGDVSPLETAKHLERALFLNPAQKDAHLIHIQLFNSYLTLSSQDAEKREAFIEQSSDHLYQAFMLDKESVSFDNQIWLANYFYDKVKSAEKDSPFDSGFLPLKRSIATFEKILGFEESIVSFPKMRDPLLLEGEALKYSELLSLKREFSKKIALLEALAQLSVEHPDMQWKHQKRSLFELAQTYEQQDNTQKAIELYDRLLKEHSPSYLTHAAQLQKTRLQFALLPDEERAESSPSVIDILNQLKDLQIKKQLQCEPVHFEAALEYVSVRVALTEDEAKLDKHLFYLKRVKEDFLSDEDIIGQEYLDARKKYPEKNRLFELYMKFVDAEMVRLQGVKAKNEGQPVEAKALLTQASETFSQLLNSEEPLTPFLEERIIQSQAELQQALK